MEQAIAFEQEGFNHDLAVLGNHKYFITRGVVVVWFDYYELTLFDSWHH